MKQRPLCSVCGGTEFRFTPVLWPLLIQEWRLSEEEAHYIDRQQGEVCIACGANLRAIALSNALLKVFGARNTLNAFCSSWRSRKIRLLEINEAGPLHSTLRKLSKHELGSYPQVDMRRLPYPDASFDVVVHSDTLEHVPSPIDALRECRRVLAPDGALCFTVPIIVGRMSLDRTGMPKSYHGDPQQGGEDFAVVTEYGADAWTHAALAGFSSVEMSIVNYPSGIAITARK